MVGKKLLSHFEENFKSKPPFVPQDWGPLLPGSPLPRVERGHWVLTSIACAAGAATQDLSTESSPGRKTQRPSRCLQSCISVPLSSLASDLPAEGQKGLARTHRVWSRGGGGWPDGGGMADICPSLSPGGPMEELASM